MKGKKALRNNKIKLLDNKKYRAHNKTRMKIKMNRMINILERMTKTNLDNKYKAKEMN